MIKKYFRYIQDNPHSYWFKARFFGWGWIPAKWQGWLLLLFFLLFIFWNSSSLPVDQEAIPVWYFIKTFSAIFILIAICYWKGEKPHWQWGFSKSKKDLSSK